MEKRFARGFVHVCGFCRFQCVLPRLLQQAPHHTHTDTLHLSRVPTFSSLFLYLWFLSSLIFKNSNLCPSNQCTTDSGSAQLLQKNRDVKINSKDPEGIAVLNVCTTPCSRVSDNTMHQAERQKINCPPRRSSRMPCSCALGSGLCFSRDKRPSLQLTVMFYC